MLARVAGTVAMVALGVPAMSAVRVGTLAVTAIVVDRCAVTVARDAASFADCRQTPPYQLTIGRTARDPVRTTVLF